MLITTLRHFVREKIIGEGGRCAMKEIVRPDGAPININISLYRYDCNVQYISIRKNALISF